MMKRETQHQASIICGKRINARRALCDYQWRHVAAETGITVHKLQRIGQGLQSPSVGDLRALAKLFRCTADHLLGLD